jgi:hypothetical protein
VDFGTESPGPLNLTPGGFDVNVGPQPPGPVDVVVTDVSGTQAVSLGAFEFRNAFQHTVPFDTDTQLGFAVKDAALTLVDGKQGYAIDTDGDARPDVSFPFPSHHANGQGTVDFDPAGVLRGLRCRTTAPDACDVELSVDLDGNGNLDDEPGQVLETLDSVANVRLAAAALGFDSAGAVAGAYTRRGAGWDVAAFHDRDGDGLLTGPNEWVVAESNVSSTWRIDLAVDPSDRLALAYYDQLDDEINVAWDRSGDGDFDDTVGSTPEMASVLSGVPVVDCLGVSFAPDGDLVLVYAEAGAGTVLARDLDGDGDFDQPGEKVTLAVGAASACDLDGAGTLAVAHAAGSLTLLVDRDGDGDFAGSGEQVALSPATGMERAKVVHADDGRVWVVTAGGAGTIFADPTP